MQITIDATFRQYLYAECTIILSDENGNIDLPETEIIGGLLQEVEPGVISVG
jgi:hypothetical protein